MLQVWAGKECVVWCWSLATSGGRPCAPQQPALLPGTGCGPSNSWLGGFCSGLTGTGRQVEGCGCNGKVTFPRPATEADAAWSTHDSAQAALRLMPLRGPSRDHCNGCSPLQVTVGAKVTVMPLVLPKEPHLCMRLIGSEMLCHAVPSSCMHAQKGDHIP